MLRHFDQVQLSLAAGDLPARYLIHRTCLAHPPPPLLLLLFARVTSPEIGAVARLPCPCFFDPVPANRYEGGTCWMDGFLFFAVCCVAWDFLMCGVWWRCDSR